MLSGSDMLSSAPKKTAQFKEIFISYNQDVAEHFNKLSQPEKVFIALMYQASIPGNQILIDQVHRHGCEVFELFKVLCDEQNHLLELEKIGSLKFEQSSAQQFIEQVKTYLVYLFTNSGQYFKKESENEKRTPSKIGLTALTQKNISLAFNELGLTDQAKRVLDLERTIFDSTYEPTLTVAGSIEKSAVNIYAKGDELNSVESFTSADYNAVSEQAFNAGACYYMLDTKGKRIPRVLDYAVSGKYGIQLTEMVKWIKLAHAHAAQFSQYFDQHLVASLEHLIKS